MTLQEHLSALDQTVQEEAEQKRAQQDNHVNLTAWVLCRECVEADPRYTQLVLIEEE